MMESNNNEIRILHKIHKDMQNVVTSLNIVIADMATLTEIVYDREMSKCNDDLDIKLHSHM